MHVKTRLQIEILKKNIMPHCECEQDRGLIRDLISRLKQSKSGSVSKGELALQYNISVRTLRRRFKSADGLLSELFDSSSYEKRRRYLLPAEIECVYKHLGIPPIKI